MLAYIFNEEKSWCSGDTVLSWSMTSRVEGLAEGPKVPVA